VRERARGRRGPESRRPQSQLPAMQMELTQRMWWPDERGRRAAESLTSFAIKTRF
jgi:hypothetical protein